ncbi:MAG: energy transducer TonB [Bacteroidales bacterium]|jgi:TonB family protein|nr:energy transducer TonB [Bacteroidales bacterium]
MKRFFILIFFACYALSLFSFSNCDTIYYNKKWKETKSKKKAKYFKTYEQLSNGLYQCRKHYKNGSIKMVGFYKDKDFTLKDSIFEFYNQNGQLYRFIKYRNNEIILCYEQIIENSFIIDTIFIKIDTMATFHSGIEDVHAFLNNYLVYPEKAKEVKLNGRVLTSFIIDQTGKICNVKIEKGVGFGCDEAALTVIKLMPLWDTGVYQGRKVKCKFFLPIRFTY